MIRHLAELSALLLCFVVGVGLLAALGIGLLVIWHPEFTTTAGEDEYRRVENAGMASIRPYDDPQLQWEVHRNFALMAARKIEPHPYNWATREPMVWTMPRD